MTTPAQDDGQVHTVHTTRTHRPVRDSDSMIGVPAQPTDRSHSPRGIGTAVSFDWAISVELIVLAGLQAAGMHALATSKTGGVLIAGALVAAIIPFAIGEGLRRGYRWAWWVQLAGNGLGTIGGLATVPGAVTSLRSGDAWPFIPTAILLVISPFIAWRLSQASTRRWIDRADRQEARRRHGGIWIAQTLVGAAIGGVLVALSVAYG